MSVRSVLSDLRAQADAERARVAGVYVGIKPGGYGEGDVMLGLTQPAVRAVEKAHAGLTLDECVALLESRYHEARMVGVLGMMRLAKRADVAGRRAIAKAYVAHPGVDNWDLIDVTTAQVVGASVLERGALAELEKLARSKSVWRRRIAIVSTFAHLRAGDAQPTLRIAALLMADEHDLIHKATGWLLREAGKRDAAALDRFLEEHAATMPRTALRYAIEKMPPATRAEWMARRGAIPKGPARSS